MPIIDSAGKFEAIKARLLQSVQNLFPVSGKTHDLKLKKAWIDDNLQADDYGSQKKSRLNARTWAVPVYVDVDLVDKETKKVIDRERKFRVAALPKMTDRGSFIVGGNEYQVQNVLRLKPGVYTRIQENGSLESQVNLAKGRNFKIFLDPKTGIFTMQVGTSNVKLYSLMLGLGLDRQTISSIWGKDLTEKNSAKSSYDEDIQKAHKAFFGEVASGTAEALADITGYFDGRTEISKETTAKTLGKSFGKVSAQMLLATSGKILAVTRGDKEPDERDSMEFKSIHDIEDMLSERIDKQARKLEFGIKRNLDRKDQIKHIISSNTFGSHVDTFFTGSDEYSTITSVTNQTNPLSMIGEANKVTLLGPGGISNIDSVTMDTRNVHPTSFGFLDPIHSPDSSKIGTTLHVAASSVKDGNEMKTALVDRRTGKHIFRTPSQLNGTVVAFSDGYKKIGRKFVAKAKKVKAIKNGELKEVSSSEVDYVFPTSKGFFDVATNMIPFLQSDQGNRAMMASKMLEQALPLKDREIPLVQTKASESVTFENIVGRGFSSAAPVAGTVTKVTPEYIHIKGSDGKSEKVGIYDRYPLNTHVYMQSYPTVKAGDKVKSGQLIADTNYTKNGTLAIGTNLTTAYMPFKGMNYEDGIAISEGAATKLTSLHKIEYSVQIDDKTVMSLKKFQAYYPNVVDSNSASKLDSDGVIKLGEEVKYGDVIFAALREEKPSNEAEQLRKLHKGFAKPYRDASQKWKDEDAGTVIDVVKRPKNITVYVHTEEKARVGDKLVGRHGNKGTITRVVTDSEMPQDASGNPIDVILNPIGIPSRINVGQVLETAAGKLAYKTGKPYLVDNFSGNNYLKDIKAKLAENGLSDIEPVFDPILNKKIGSVSVGKQYILKLDHSTRKKFSARSRAGYTADMTPSRGGGEGGLSIGKMEFASLLAAGAKHNLREMATIKAENNDEFWRALHTGQPLPAPKMTFATEKLEAMIKGSGIDIDKNGHSLQLTPMTDKQIKGMSNGEIKDALALRGKDLRPEKGGIFDPLITGGIEGKHWNHVKLAEPMPSPVFEKAIRELLDITGSEYRKYIDGKKWLNKRGDVVPEGTKGAVTSGSALKILLGNIDVDSYIRKLKAGIPKLRGSDLNKANRKLRYLIALKEKGQDPTVYVLSVFPTLPATFRPIYAMPDGNLTVSEVNDFYRDMILVNNQLKDKTLPEGLKDDLRRDLYDGLKGVAGLGGSLTGRPRKGLIEQIAGDRPKTGFFQSKIMSKRQDYSGRSTIVSEASLGLDETMIPEQMAWKLYEPFIIRELVMMGYTPLAAKDELDKKGAGAKRALELVMQDRPVILNRAPTLHKFSVMSFKPKLTSGKAIKINPLVVEGYNADFDGDAMQVHVPITEAARQEAHKLMPSSNLFSPRDGTLMNAPRHEQLLGLFLMTQSGGSSRKSYPTPDKALAGYRAGEVKLTDTVTIAGKRITVGRALVNAVLPQEYRDSSIVFSKKTIEQRFRKLAKDKPQVYAQVIGKLKDLGNTFAYETGFTVSLKDLEINTGGRDKIFAAADKRAKSIGTVRAYTEATAKLDKWLDKELGTRQNAFHTMWQSGAKGNSAQVRQIVAAPVMVKDIHDKAVPYPIKGSYAEGLTVSDYLASMAGARKGMVDRALMTAQPGAFSKEYVASAINERITMNDCGTHTGSQISVNDPDAVGRYLAKPASRYGHYNELVTPALLAKIRGRMSTITVRGPMTCEAPDGICQKCYGLDENGSIVDSGRNVGVLAAQAITEPLTQFTMRCINENSIIPVKVNGVQAQYTLADLYDLVQEQGQERDGVTTKSVDGIEVWDGVRWVRTTSIQRHKPSVPMVCISAPGALQFCQENHPIVVYDPLRCEVCGGKISPVLENDEEVYRCVRCRRELPAVRSSGGSIVPADKASDKSIIVDYRGYCGDHLHVPDIPGYFAGMYLADGCIRIGNGTPKYQGVPVAVIVTKHDSERRYKDRIKEELNGYIEFSSHEKDIQIYSPKFAEKMSEMCPGKAHKKRLNIPIASTSKEWLLQLLAGLLDGDGSVVCIKGRKTHMHFYSTSFALVQQVQIIAALLGIKTNCSVGEPRVDKRGERYSGKHVRYVLSVYIPANHALRSVSVKTGDLDAPLRRKRSPLLDGYPLPVGKMKHVTYSGEYVYDIKTDSGMLMVGMMQTHNTFHTGSVMGTKKDPAKGLMGGFERIKEMLEMHQHIRGKASLAEVDGKVDSLKKSPTGGWNLTVGGREHFIDPGRDPIVKNGQNIGRGDRISDGNIKAQELLQYKGMGAVKDYLVDALDTEYQSQGIKVNKKIFETAIRPLTNNAQIMETGKSKHIAGDFATISAIEHFNKGKDDSDQIKYDPMVKGVNTYPLQSKDWLHRLNYVRLKDSLTQGASEGWKSDIMKSPVGSYAYGIFFGQDGQKTASADLPSYDSLFEEDTDEPEEVC